MGLSVHSRWSLDPGQVRRWLAVGRRHWLALAVLLLAAATYHMCVLLRTPAPGVDEAWLASRACGLLETGKPFGTLDSGVIDRYEGYWASGPWLLTSLHALAIRALGLSLWSVRVVSLAFGLVLLTAVYVIGLRVGGRRVGLLASFLTAMSLTFHYSGHLARQDIIVAALGFAAIALYLTDSGPGLTWKSLASALLVTIGLDIHLTASFYGLVLVGLYAIDYGWGTLRLWRFWGFALAGAAGVLLWAAVHILPYPRTYVSIVSVLLQASGVGPPLLTLDPGIWIESVAGTAVLLAWPGKLWLVPPALAYLSGRRAASLRRALLLLAVLVVAFVAWIRNKPLFYAIMVAPMGNVVAAALVVRLLDQRQLLGPDAPGRVRRAHGVLIGVVVTVITLDLILVTTATLLSNPMADYRLALARINEVVRPGGTVLGSQTYWFGMPQQRYLSWEQLAYYRRYAPGSTLQDAFEDLRPDYLIVDSHMAQWIVADKTRAPRHYEELYLPANEFRQFLVQRAELLAQVDSKTFGRVRVYRVNWTEE